MSDWVQGGDGIGHSVRTEAELAEEGKELDELSMRKSDPLAYGIARMERAFRAAKDAQGYCAEALEGFQKAKRSDLEEGADSALANLKAAMEDMERMPDASDLKRKGE